MIKRIRRITIEKGDKWEIVFNAPDDKYVAYELWIFLVENLQPGFVVTIGSGPSANSRGSGSKVPIELYRQLMEEG